LALCLFIAISGVAGQCAGRLPLTGRLGVQLFCGVGPGSVTCPVGSACIMPTGVCCPVVVTTIAPLPLVPPVVIAKCQSGSPWKNVLGVEYFCGPGANHFDCPMGSECITGPHNEFFACCSRPVTPVVPTVSAGPIIVAKCQIGSPLLNAAGAEIFCGPGANHGDCPVNSQCIFGPNGEFATCCALAGTTVTFTPQPSFITTAPPMRLPQSTGTVSGSASMSISGAASMSTSMPSETNMTEGEDNSTDTTDMTASEASGESTQQGTAEVRFLNIRLLDPTDAIATWAPPNGTTSIAYTAEISYDGKTWKRLKTEDPTSTFAEFMVTAQMPFEVRVTPEGGAASMADWPKQKKSDNTLSGDNTMNGGKGGKTMGTKGGNATSTTTGNGKSGKQ